MERFDDKVNDLLSTLKETGQWDNTLIVICSDNGWQMPRRLANLYDFGTRVPLIIYWKGHITENRTVSDFTNFNDHAHAFFEVTGIEVPFNLLKSTAF